MTFDQWMKKRSPGYLPSDDGEILRSLRECWLAAQKAERERDADCPALRATFLRCGQLLKEEV